MTYPQQLADLSAADPALGSPGSRAPHDPRTRPPRVSGPTAPAPARACRNEATSYYEVDSARGFPRASPTVPPPAPPTRVRKAEPAGSWSVERVEQPALRHHHLKT